MIGRTPNSFVVGTGRLATAIAGGLRLAGVPVLGLWGRRPERARSAGATSGVAAFSSAPPDLLLEANVILLAVSDDAIADVAAMLVGTGLVSRSHVLLHSSGVMSSAEAFGAVADRVGGIATMHPLKAIADGAAAMRHWRGCVFGVEGDESGKRAAADIVAALGGNVLALEGDAMAAYHAAAATASNFLVALLASATDILAGAGISPERAQAALLPLMSGTLENLAEGGPQRALTGPIRRGDVETIARHLRVLESSPPAVARAYRTMAALTVGLARDIGEASSEALDAIEALLDGSDSESGAVNVKAVP